MKVSKIQARKNLNERLKELKSINEYNFDWVALEKRIKSNSFDEEIKNYNVALKDWINDISEIPIRSIERRNMEAPENWYFRKTQKAGVWVD